jgi:hypothetical protein
MEDDWTNGKIVKEKETQIKIMKLFEMKKLVLHTLFSDGRKKND